MLRHGQTTANEREVFSGSQDVDLTDLGRQQAHANIPVFVALQRKPTIIIHSHRSRARDTAQIVNTPMGLEMIEDSRLAEQDFGDWEGQPVIAIRPHILAGEDPPNGETNQEFYDRVREAFMDHLGQHDAPALFVCHGGIWRAFRAIYGQETMIVKNCEPHLFNPAPENTTFPWSISDFKSKGFQSALKIP
jgi:probable phosphoglycerate mutase